jgi:hypothetical protein
MITDAIAYVLILPVAKHNLVNGVPFIQMNPNYLEKPGQAPRQVLSELARSREQFWAFRAILFTPKQVETLAIEVRNARPDVEFVDMHTLLLLYKQSLTVGR